MTDRIFRGGVPTAPDVAKLMKLSIVPGSRIAHDEVEVLLGLDRKQSRFLTVTQAWRRRVFRERRLQIESRGGYFWILTAAEAVSSGITAINRIGRATGRTVLRAEVIDTTALDEGQLRQHTLLRRHAAAARLALVDACRSIAASPQPASGATLRLAANLSRDTDD